MVVSKCSNLFRAVMPETRASGSSSCVHLTMFFLQAGRLNHELDYDSLHYGLRSAYVLDNGNGIYKNLGLINLVYTYSKGAEVLVLPLSGTPTYRICPFLYFLDNHSQCSDSRSYGCAFQRKNSRFLDRSAGQCDPRYYEYGGFC